VHLVALISTRSEVCQSAKVNFDAEGTFGIQLLPDVKAFSFQIRLRPAAQHVAESGSIAEYPKSVLEMNVSQIAGAWLDYVLHKGWLRLKPTVSEESAEASREDLSAA
jgi:hypothetical protein